MIAFTVFPVSVFAADVTIDSNGIYDIGDYGNDSVITIDPGLTVTLTNTAGTTYTDVSIVCGAGVSLTINDIRITNGLNYLCPIAFIGSGNQLILEGNSELKSDEYEPGIRVEDSTELEISGTGSVTARGSGGGAGIGGGYNSNGGSITITSGTVTAYAGADSAGIGGGLSGSGGTITISGGTVTANGPTSSGCGIGGAGGGSGIISITGGTVNANGGADGAGIGGFGDRAGDSITISGGTVTAIGGNSYGAGNSGSFGCDGGEITISGGIITANGGGSGGSYSGGAGIGGGGSGGSGGTINISDGHVTANGGEGVAGIGSGSETNGGTITITGGTIIANGGGTFDSEGTKYYGGAGIGGGFRGDGGTISISDATVTAVGGDHSAGIGGGSGGSAGTISIDGGVVYAQKGDTALYDIGDGEGGAGGTLGISGDSVVVLRNGDCITPTTVHTLMTFNTVTDDQVYGIELPNSWTAPVYTYFNESYLYDLIYDANGGTGTVPDTKTQYVNTTISVADGNGLTNDSEYYNHWNTSSSDSGTTYMPDDEYTFIQDNTLYAIYHTATPVAGVSLNKSTTSIKVDNTDTLTEMVSPANATNKNVTWSSDDESVATVEDGVITGVSAGIATITVKTENGGYKDTCEVTVVTQPVTGVSLNKSTTSIKVDDTDTLSETVSPSDATNKNVTWLSDDESVATVADGVVTGVSAGIATIAVETEDRGYKDTCDITVTPFAGTGTEPDPYRIQSAEDLAALATLIDEGDSPFADAFYLQTTDIDLSGYTNWKPIGNQNSDTYMFQGSYDGGNNSISNLSINETSDSLDSFGLFGYARGEIKNLNIDGGMIIVRVSYGVNVGSIVGSIVGRFNGGTVENCSSSAKIGVGTFSRDHYVYVGGVIGAAYDNNVIKNCSYSGSMSAVNSYHNGGYIGGIVGLTNPGTSTVSDCLNTGSIYGEGIGMRAAGIIGLSFGANLIERCFNTGDVTSHLTRNYYGFSLCGGIVSESSSTNITDCFNLGTITASGDKYEVSMLPGAGGIAADYGTGTIENCYNAGMVYADYYGGIGGELHSDTTLIGCYYADTCELADGDGNFSANKCTLEQMKNQTTFADFDFINTWEIVEGEYYPVLQDLPFAYTTGISISQSTEELSVNETVQLTATVNPSEATGQNVVWVSDNDSVATVDRTGLVTGKKAGTATITSTTADGGFSEKCYITVVTGVSLNKSTMNIKVGSTDTLTATVSPADATNKNVTWYSSDESVATVEDGVVTAVSTGNATIHVQTERFGYSDSCVVTVELFDGTGTELDPLLIQSAEDLAMLATSVNQGAYSTDGKYYKQTADIDLSSNGIWEPIGCGVEFSGTYDGDGYKVSNMYITGYSITYAGLFESVYNGTIKNVNMEGGTIDADDMNNRDVGSVVGRIQKGTVINCSSSTSIIQTLSMCSFYGMGGIVGTASQTTISGCKNLGKIDSHNATSGGIVGLVSGDSEIIDCENYGDIHYKGTIDRHMGGIVGYISPAQTTIRDCSNYGNISADSFYQMQIGGIVGTCNVNADVSILQCSNAGDISISDSNGACAGGIAGCISSGDISECYNLGDITVREPRDTCVGGIVGKDDYENSILYLSDCFNVGNMICRSTLDPVYMGGIIGYGMSKNDTYTNCYNVGEISNNYYGIGYAGEIGGIAGRIDYNDLAKAFKNCYYADTCDTGIGDGEGKVISKTMIELKQQASFSGFDFTNIWEIVEGERFPILKNVPFEYVAGISLDETLSLEAGKWKILVGEITPADASNKNLSWTSDDESVAVVNNGAVTGVSGGTATIIVETADGGITDTCTVTVTQRVTGVSLDKSTTSIEVGSRGSLTAMVSPSGATNKSVTWSSSNSSIATVANGVVTAKGAGTATITVTTEDGGYTDTCVVTVTQTASGVQLNKSSINLLVGDNDTLTATVLPSNAVNKNVTWKSTNTSVATVSNGVVTAKGAGTATITVTTEDGRYIDTCTVTVGMPSVRYQTHVQNVGWQGWKSNGEVAGTSGQSLRLEGMYIEVVSIDNAIEYRTHVQNIGWQDWVSDGEMTGTSGRSLRLEAIEIRLTGYMADNYDIYYRVHAENFGWMDWAKNGQSSGTAGFSYRLEAIEIVLVEKGGAAPGPTMTPFRDVNDPNATNPTKPAEPTDPVNPDPPVNPPGTDESVRYQTHVQDIGWQDWVSDGEMTGTSGRSLRLEAIDIRLTGEIAKLYDVYYRVHAQNFGWMDWAKNGQSAGTAGFSYRLEAIQIVLVDKGGTAPGSTVRPFISA